jgi:hypothetical protein
MALSTYVNPLLGIKMEYPASWTKQDNVAGAVVSFSPTADESVNTPSLNIVVQDLSSNPLSLDDFTTVSLYQMEQMLTEVKGMSVNPRELAGNPGKNISYTTTLQNTTLKFRQVFTLVENIAYIITFSAPINVHDNYSVLIETCINTFSLIPQRGIGSISLVPVLNKPYSYFIRVPKGWERQEFSAGSVQRFDYKRQGVSQVTLIVNVDYFPQDNLETYTNIVKSQISQITDAPNPIVGDAQLGGVPAKRATFHTSATLVPGRYFQIWTVHEKFAGVITMIHNTPADDPEQDEYKPLFERVLDSFSFVTPDYVLDPSYKYENLTLGFSINFPERFMPQEGFMGATVSFVIPEPMQTSFGTNINVVVQRMPNQVLTLDEFCNTIKQQLDSTVENIQTTGESYLPIAGVTGKESHYSGRIEDQLVKFVQRVAIVHDKAVVLSFAVERDKFEKEFRTVGKYLDTFKFI